MRGKKNLDYLKAQSSGSESKSKSKKSQKKNTENTLDIQQQVNGLLSDVIKDLHPRKEKLPKRKK